MPVPNEGFVDVHSHFISDTQRSALDRQSSGKDDGIKLPPWDTGKQLAFMDQVGTQYAVLSTSTPSPQFRDEDDARRIARGINEDTARLVSEHPDRYGAVAFLPLPYVDLALEELAYAVDELGFLGAHMFTNYEGKYAGHEDFEPLLDEINRRKLTTLTHPTSPADVPDAMLVGIQKTTLEFIFDTTRMAASLLYEGSLERFPDINWVLSHAGGTLLQSMERLCRCITITREETNRTFRGIPETADRGRELMRRLHVDVVWNEYDPALPALVETFGSDHLLYGSDMPFEHKLDLARGDIDRLRAHPNVDDATKAGILRDNALALFPAIAAKLKQPEPA